MPPRTSDMPEAPDNPDHPEMGATHAPESVPNSAKVRWTGAQPRASPSVAQRNHVPLAVVATVMVPPSCWLRPITCMLMKRETVTPVATYSLGWGGSRTARSPPVRPGTTAAPYGMGSSAYSATSNRSGPIDSQHDTPVLSSMSVYTIMSCSYWFHQSMPGEGVGGRV